MHHANWRTLGTRFELRTGSRHAAKMTLKGSVKRSHRQGRGRVAGGRSCRATAALFGVSVASVVKWSQRYRATGTAAAKPMGGHRRRILRDERDWLVARIAEKPDLTFAGGAGRAGGARHGGELWRGVGVLRQRGDHVQKKACTPANKTGPTSHAGGCGGRSIRAGLTQGAWSSSTRPGPRPT
jgi:transposase